MKNLELKWIEPLELAEKISVNYSKNWIFLYSALNHDVKNSVSYIALHPKNQIISDNFSDIKLTIEKSFGYFSYELYSQFENLPINQKSFIDLPKIWLINFSVIFEFHHETKKILLSFDDEKKLQETLSYQAKAPVFATLEITNFNSNFSDQSYLETISAIKKLIANGDFYQTNLTRKFFGEFKKKNTHEQNFQLFLKLTKSSPANYASFIKLDENYIISSSPELFLSGKNHQILSRPIKGTAPRNIDKTIDENNKTSLQNSTKEKAENLMIVDLVRNDLSRFCKAGTVTVKKLFDITSYQTIHHMSSEISGEILPEYNYLDALKSCFPPGSMTGAPKIKAMEIAIEKEKINRGIYSGAIGFVSEEEINLSVVIRTLILSENKFEFQVGGAITFDSDPKLELAEIFAKAKAIFNLLSVDFNRI